MTEQPEGQPTRQAIAAKDRSAPSKVTGRLRAALIEMVWKGSRRADAALIAKMTDHSLRAALKKPHVKAFYLSELGALRESTRAKNFHRLDTIADSSRNDMAKVAAIKTMEAITEAEATTRAGGVGVPGVTIRIVNVVQGASAPAHPIINVTPAEARLPPPVHPPEAIFRDPRSRGNRE